MKEISFSDDQQMIVVALKKKFSLGLFLIYALKLIF